MNDGNASIDRGHNWRTFEGGEQQQPRRNVVGERVARVVGGMQQQQRLALTVSVLGLDAVDSWSSGRSGYEYDDDIAADGVVAKQICGRGGGSPIPVAADDSSRGGGGLLSPCGGAIPSACPPPLTPSPLPSPVSSTDGTSNKRVILSKLRKRVIDSRNKLSLHKAWWHRCVLISSSPTNNSNMLMDHTHLTEETAGTIFYEKKLFPRVLVVYRGSTKESD